MLIALLAAAASPLPACSAAVHAMAPAAILSSCPAPAKTNLWSGPDPDPCAPAFAFARDAAHMADSPPAMIRGLVAEFDKRVAECSTPEPPKPLPPKDCASVKRLWC